MPIVYNARWHLSTGTSRNGEKTLIYHERRTCFRDPRLYVDVGSRTNRRRPWNVRARQHRKFTKKSCPARGRSGIGGDQYSGLAFGLY
jgi:hypothetical protein